MSAPLIDIHVKNILELGLKTIRSNPDRYLKEIFGDYTIEAHATLYGKKTIDDIRKFVETSRIPVVLGFEVNEAMVPCVTIHLASSAASMPVLGDESLMMGEDLEVQQRDVLVPLFVPKTAVFNAAGSIEFTLPDEMPFATQELFFSGLIIRDPSKREYSLNTSEEGALMIVEMTSQAPLKEIDLTSLELVSPYTDTSYNQGMMVFDEQMTVAVHGHASRQEGFWLFSIVMWSILRFRPLLAGTYGIDMATLAASDYSRDETFSGSQVWRRYIQVQCKTVWSWETNRNQDLLGLLLHVAEGRSQK